MSGRLQFVILLMGVFALGMATGLWLIRGAAILLDYSFVGCM